MASPFDFSQCSLLVCTPCYGGMVFEGYMRSILDLQRLADQVKMRFATFTITNESLIPRGRNTCVAQFLASDFTHMMFIDADITFDPMSVLRMIAFNQPVVAGCYPQKWVNINGAAEILRRDPLMDPEEALTRSHRYVVNWDTTGATYIKNEAGNIVGLKLEVAGDGFISVSEAGTGFMLLKREVFDVMRARMPDQSFVNDQPHLSTPEFEGKWWLFFDCMIHPESRRYLSEDYAFSWKWVNVCGGKIWLDTTAKLNHTGTYTFKGDVGKYLGFDRATSTPPEGMTVAGPSGKGPAESS